MKRSKINNLIIILLVFAVYLIPGFFGAFAVTSIVFFLFLFNFLEISKIYKNNLAVILAVLVLNFFIVLSIILQPLRDYPIVFDDVELYILFIKDFILIYTILNLKNFNRLKIFKSIIVFSVISSFICLVQFYDIGGLNKLYLSKVTTDLTAEYFSKGYIRSIGFAGNPNIASMINALGGMLVFSLFLDNYKFKYFVLFVFILFGGVITTGSRTSLIILIISALILFFSKIREQSFKTQILSFFLFGIIVSIIFFVFLVVFDGVNNAAFNRIFRLADISTIIQSKNSSSIAIRIYVVAPKLFADWMKHPFLGNGFAQGTDLFPFADIGFLYYLRVFGIFGFISFLVLFIIMYFKLKRLYNGNRFAYSRFQTISLVIVLLILVTQEFGIGKVTPIYWLICTMLYNKQVVYE